MRSLIQHEAILASAGSGKTFQLAHRYIRLLAHGVEPHRIIAITFSRKAAGEIFTAVVTHLRTAASSDREARTMAERIQMPDLNAADFLAILRRFLNDLQRLHISTIDSFTIGILRTFPMELGVSPVFDVTNNQSVEAEQARFDALSRLFRAPQEDEESKRELLEAFKQATHGRETKTFAREFDQFIADYQEFYKLLPHRDRWGEPSRIWPDGCPWLTPPTNLTAAIESLRTHTQAPPWASKAQEKWKSFLDELADWHPGLPWGRIAYLADKLINSAEPLRTGSAVITLWKKYTVDGPPTEWMTTLIHHLMHICIKAALESTQGIHRLLDRFEQLYDAEIRRPGLITFDDAQFLIIQGGRTLSRMPDDPTRLHIDFRLDSRLDHWLIDEFQDTSDLQWDVLRNLADEVLQDTHGTRSFYFVGDVKQAIYGWRGGNYKLFGQILEQYGTRIQQRPLNVSFRSSQPILDAVNQAFDTLPDDVPEPVRDQWRHYWGEHTCRQDKAPPPGHMAFIEAGEDRNNQEACYNACADVLREIDPLRRGLTVAILVRRNKTARHIANIIRAACPEIPVAIEGESEVADNPGVVLLLALIHYAAHPGDTLAREHIRMSPLADAFHGTSAGELLTGIYRYGYQDFLRRWGDRLEEARPLDDFGRHRLHALIDAAGEFDATGKRQPDEFTAFIRAYTFPEQAADSTVRIMTMHSSKGLGFDVIILPELTGKVVAGLERGIHVARDAEGQPDWALLMPNKSVRAEDNVLRRETEQAEYDGTFESLCVLYVALTRAKRGLYCIAAPPPKKSEKVVDGASFLRLQLGNDLGARPKETLMLNATTYGVIYETGTRDWFEDCSPPKLKTGVQHKPIPARFPKKKSKRRRLLRVSPSSRAEETRPAHLFFEPKVTRSLDFGTAVHELFERVDWSDHTPAEEAVAHWRETIPEIDDEAVAHFKEAYRTPEFQEALKKPEGEVTLWREKMFEAVIDDEWVTGTFDRVVVVRDAAGKVITAEILDFKTNDVSEETITGTVDHYRPQLKLYARALAKLINFPADRIACKLLFTRPGRVITA